METKAPDWLVGETKEAFLGPTVGRVAGRTGKYLLSKGWDMFRRGITGTARKKKTWSNFTPYAAGKATRGVGGYLGLSLGMSAGENLIRGGYNALTGGGGQEQYQPQQTYYPQQYQPQQAYYPQQQFQGGYGINPFQQELMRRQAMQMGQQNLFSQANQAVTQGLAGQTPTPAPQPKQLKSRVAALTNANYLPVPRTQLTNGSQTAGGSPKTPSFLTS